MLDIRLLGPPLVYLDGELVPIKRRITRALLFYLAAYGKPIGRTQLAEFFWPEEEDEKQRRQLRGTLNKLRNALPDNKYLQTYQDTIALDFERISVDVQEFRELLADAGNFSKTWSQDQPLPAHIYQQLIKATELWHGTVFIHSDVMSVSRALEQWWMHTSQSLGHEYMSVLKGLIRHENIVGNNEKALHWLRIAHGLDDLDEDLHYSLLVCLLKFNQPEKVRQHYAGVQALFKERLEAPPSERIRSLEPLIFSKREASPSHARAEWPIRSSVHVPFVGQQDALQTLKLNFLNGVATLILGEAGAGKTRLVQEVYQSLEVKPRLLLLPCYPADEKLPYQPWVDMLRESIEEHFWQELSALWAEPLTMLLPELLEIRGDLGGKLGDTYARPIIFEAIKNLLTLISKEEPCLLFVDDAQWADDATLRLLVYLQQQSSFQQGNLRLVITARFEEKISSQDQLLIGALKEHLDIIEMLRLTENDISNLAIHLLDENLSSAVSERLLLETGGNPFFILEMLSAIWALPDRGNLEISLPVPASVKKLILLRLKPLTQDAKDILILAAIQGNPFDLALLEKSAALSSDDLTPIISELEDAQLIRSSSQKNYKEYAFVHEIIREILISSLTSIKSRLLHKTVAQAIETKSGEHQDPLAAILAEHYEKAGNPSRAFDLWVRAGKYAYHLLSLQDATVSYQRAKSLIDDTNLDIEQIYNLYSAWDMLLFSNDDPDNLEELMESLLSIGQERGSDLLIGTAWDGMSDVCMIRNQFEEGLAYSDKALRYLETSKHIVAQMNAQIRRGVFLYMLNQFAESQEPFQIALQLGEGNQDLEVLAASGHANYQMAVSWVGMGWPAKALAYAKRSLRELTISRAIQDPIIAHGIMGLANYYLANYEEGRSHAYQSIALATKKEYWRMLGYASTYAGLNETELASFGAAWSHAQKAIKIGESYAHSEISSMGYKILGDIYMRLDALPQAAEAYQQGVDVDKGSFAMLENLARLGLTLSLLGDPNGDDVLQKALGYAKDSGLDVVWGYAKALELSVFITRGDNVAFEENLPEVRKYLKERSHPDSDLWIKYLQALSLSRGGETERAVEQLEIILPALEGGPFFWIKIRALKLYVQTLHTLGRDIESPRDQLEEMLQKIEGALGDAPLQDEWQAFAERTLAITEKSP